MQPKPGSNTVSDDAGTQPSVQRESLFAKRARLRREERKARADQRAAANGGGSGGPVISSGTSSTSAFR